jgi:multisubunit Na+/H+ antiporter MnhB subunit
MRVVNKITLLFAMLLVSTLSFAQNPNSSSDFMRQSGRIYVVVGVILIILIGLVLYLVRLDRKISKLEKNNSQ